MNVGPQRIVSLVPSLTEALFVLGLGARVVGVTDWCVHPAAEVAGLPKVGGTKTPDLAAIRALSPDLVIANHEENRRTDVEQLERAGLRVWVTYPRTVREGAELLAELADLGADADRVRSFVTPVLDAVQQAEEASVAVPVRVFCPIWRDPWMVPGPDTYVHDLIRLCGGSNPFSDLETRRYPSDLEVRRYPSDLEVRRYPSGRYPSGRYPSGRYPRVALDAVVEAAPEVILLPDEPYAFGPRDAAELAKLPVPAAAHGRIHLIDGTLVSWYGPRIREAVEKLRGFFAT